MPELPEVETTRRGVQMAVQGRKIIRATVRRHDLRVPIPAHLAKSLAGKSIVGVRRRAKYLLVDLSSGEILLVHLGMSGSLVVMPKAGYVPRTHDHVLIELDNNTLMVFHDPRRFGVVDWLNAGDEVAHPMLKNLGPEPLERDFSPAYLSAQLKRRKGPIKSVLMDQKLVVGVGNIYASEALHLCKLNPSLPAHLLAPKADAIIAAIRTTLMAAIDSGGSTLRDYVGAGSEGGYFQHQFQVYGRDGKPCFRCGNLIETCTHAGRSTYWCLQCQQNRVTRQKS